MGSGRRPQDRGEERRRSQPRMEGHVRLSGGTFVLIRKTVLFPWGATVPGSTPWKAESRLGCGCPLPSAGRPGRAVAYTAVGIRPALAL